MKEEDNKQPFSIDFNSEDFSRLLNSKDSVLFCGAGSVFQSKTNSSVSNITNIADNDNDDDDDDNNNDQQYSSFSPFFSFSLLFRGGGCRKYPLDDPNIFFSRKKFETSSSLLSVSPFSSLCHKLNVRQHDDQKGFFSSKCWVGQFEANHIDVKYTPAMMLHSRDFLNSRPTEFSSLSFLTSFPSAAAACESSSGIDKIDWNEVYTNALSSSQPQLPQQVDDVKSTDLKSTDLKSTSQPNMMISSALSSPVLPEKTNHTRKGRERGRRRKKQQLPETRVYVKPTDQDVLLGRGGRSNHHKGNKVYREQVDELKPCYRNSSKDEKTEWSQCLVDFIRHNCEGRFLQYDKDAKQWYIVSNTVARKKASQALREDNTPQARAAKREKYGEKYKKKTKKKQNG